jgi:hypothetical protein
MLTQPVEDPFSLAFLGRSLLLFAAFIAIVGVILIFADKLPFLGRLPGDINVQRGNTSFQFPIATSIVISIILTVVLNLVLLLFRR